MKKIISMIILLTIVISGTVYAESQKLEIGKDIYNVVTTFCGDAKTSRGFAWSAEKEFADMVIQYSNADEWETENTISEARYTEYDNRLYYKAELINLCPGTTYVYRIGDTRDNIWSDTYTFTTEAKEITQFSFIGVADPQSNSWTGGFNIYNDVLDKAIQDKPNAAFMVNLGD